MSKKDIINKKNNNMVSLVLFALAASSLLLSVVYAAMTSSLKITGDATVYDGRYSAVYYHTSKFYEDESCTIQIKDDSDLNITKLSTMVSRMKNNGTIYIKSEYTTTTSETITTDKTVTIKRYGTSAANDYTGDLINVSDANNIFTISPSSTGHIILDGNRRDPVNLNITKPLVRVKNNGTLEVNRKVTFQNNRRSTGGQYGAAIFLESSGKFYSLLGSDITFSNNHSHYGGAIGVGDGTNTSTIQLRGTVKFINNNATHGGALHVAKNSSAYVPGYVDFIGNIIGTAEGYLGGAIYNNGYLELSGVSKLQNNTAGQGGAIYSEGNTLSLTGTIDISNNTAGKWGGAIYTASTNNNFSGNITLKNNTAGTNGGGIYVKTADSLNLSGTITLDGNKAYRGGAIYSENVPLLSLGGTVTIKNNNATNSGGGLYISLNGTANKMYIGCMASGTTAVLTDKTVSFTGNTDGNSGSYYKSYNIYATGSSFFKIFISSALSTDGMNFGSVDITKIYS